MITLTLHPALVGALGMLLVVGLTCAVLLTLNVTKVLKDHARRRRLESRLEDHDGECYGYYWRRRLELEDRIRKLETELARVPRAMRSRKTQKLVGK